MQYVTKITQQPITSFDTYLLVKKFLFKLLVVFSMLLASPTVWALTSDESKHLLLRAGFGAQLGLMEQLKVLNPAEAVNYLLSRAPQYTAPPACVTKPLPSNKSRKSFSTNERKLFNKSQRQCAVFLKAWYLEQLIKDNAVLVNQMTLFWQNLFTSSLKKVKYAKLIYQQHLSIQSHAIGDFSVLLKQMIHDPALLIYLDNTRNAKGKPNENLARELLELFTLGEGNYSEADVLSAAKALTGLSVDNNKQQSKFYKKRHDNSTKIIFNDFRINDANDLIGAILSQEQTAVYITRALWLHFISKENDVKINALAQYFATNWDIKLLLREILLSRQFWQDQGLMYKSPVELIIGNAKLFKGQKIATKRLLKMTRNLGQDLFDPPNVKGWPKGKAWIDTNKLVLRNQLTDQLARAISSNMASMGSAYCNADKLASLNALPQMNLENMQPNKNNDNCQRLLLALITDPSWQLK